MSITQFEKLQIELPKQPKTWLVTGVAGFIGSNILEKLLRLEQTVVGIDNFSTGYQENLDEVQGLVSEEQWKRFRFINGDIRNYDECIRACYNIDYVLHQAALGSVPRSLDDPIATNETNITGFLNMLVAAKGAKVKSFIYAASSSTYGDQVNLPKVEGIIGRPLSPYAVTKYVNELYAEVFARAFEFKSIGLRYFNVFGPRQDSFSAYSAVIPKWIGSMFEGKDIYINGDGETSRDFTYVENAIQCNILAATANVEDSKNQVYNVALGEQTSLNRLFRLLSEIFKKHYFLENSLPRYCEYRVGDIRHSVADITKAKAYLNYLPSVFIKEGLELTIEWYSNNRNRLQKDNIKS